MRGTCGGEEEQGVGRGGWRRRRRRHRWRNPFLSTLPWESAVAKLLHKLLYKGHRFHNPPGHRSSPTQCNTAYLTQRRSQFCATFQRETGLPDQHPAVSRTNLSELLSASRMALQHLLLWIHFDRRWGMGVVLGVVCIVCSDKYL